jgi:uncharacterized membrane protein
MDDDKSCILSFAWLAAESIAVSIASFLLTRTMEIVASVGIAELTSVVPVLETVI